jgi:hypothetical protein
MDQGILPSSQKTRSWVLPSEVNSIILVYNSNQMHKTQSLFNLIIALHVSGVTITHLQEHKTTASTASGNHYTVLLPAAMVEKLER